MIMLKFRTYIPVLGLIILIAWAKICLAGSIFLDAAGGWIFVGGCFLIPIIANTVTALFNLKDYSGKKLVLFNSVAYILQIAVVSIGYVFGDPKGKILVDAAVGYLLAVDIVIMIITGCYKAVKEKKEAGK